MVTLANKYIKAKISEHGAELCSLLHNNTEYIWQANPKYWSRHAPILFPIVGKVFNDEYRIEGEKYTLSQHGFARDKDFQLLNSSDTEATFILRDDDETLKLYPYHFELHVKYALTVNQLTTTYTIHNTDNKTIYFQIGGHPAFNYPNWPFHKGYLQLLKDGSPLTEIFIRRTNAKGYITDYIQRIELPNGALSVKNDTFDLGTIILENTQCDTIKMMNGDGSTHLSLSSNAKLFGIWSPEHKNAPFICLEPWLGRADDNEYNGSFKDKPYINILEPNREMTLEYTINL